MILRSSILPRVPWSLQALGVMLLVLTLTTGCPRSSGGKGGGGLDEVVNNADAKANPGALLSEGNRLMDEGDFEGAIANYTRAIDADPRFQAAYENRAVAYTHERKFNEALSDFAEALDIGPESPQLFFNLGNLYASYALFEEAAKTYQRSLELDADQSAALNNLGNAYCALRRYEQARQTLEELTRRFPDVPEGFNNLGVVHEMQGQIDLAAELYRRSIEVDPKYADAHLSLGMLLYRKKGQDREALRLLKAFLKLAPEEASERHKVRGTIERLEVRINSM